MLKRLLILLILCIVMVAGLYQVRIRLLTTVFNTVLEQADIRLLQLDGLEFGWDSLNVRQLVLAVGDDSAPQTLQDIHLVYNLLDVRPEVLSVGRAVLTRPVPAADAPGTQSQLFFTELAGQLMAAPLESITVEALEVNGFSSPLIGQPLRLQASWQNQLFLLVVQERDRQLELRLRRSAADQLALTAGLTRGDKPVIQLSATIDQQQQGRQQFQGNGQLSVDALMLLLAPRFALPEPVTGVSGDMVFQWSGLLDDDLALLAKQQWQMQVMPATVLEVELAGEEQSPKNSFTLKPPAEMQFDGDRLSVTLAAGEWLRAGSLKQGDIVASGPALVADSAANVEYQLSTGRLRLQLDQLQLMLPQVQMPELNLATRLVLSDLDLSVDADSTLNGRVHLAADAVNVQRPGMWLPAIAIASDITIAGQLLGLTGQVQAGGGKPMFEVTASYNLDSGRGDGRLRADTLSFETDNNRLSQYFASWPFEWDILEGSLMLDVATQWRSGEQGVELSGEISQSMKGLSGVYKDIGFIGLDGNIVAGFESPDQLITTRMATISLDTLDIGVPVEAIQASFTVDAAEQKLGLESVEARLFGGRIWVENAIYRAGNAHNPVHVGVDGMQVEQLLALAGYDAVRGSGSISGLLPLDVSPEGFTMTRGMLAAKEPGGVFRYSTEIAEGTNPAMRQVIEALSNYHYTIFQVEADYLPSGDLLLEMVLRGSNPDLQQGRPVHLNLNVTDNIPMLLKSLQSGRVIADSVSKKLGG